jgi:Ner family transcriptional regulator
MNQLPTDWHPADLIAALKKRQLSLKQLSRDHGYAPDVLKVALRRPYPKAERIIAAALGVAPEVIWPSRYNAAGGSNRSHPRRAAEPAGANANRAAATSIGAIAPALQEFTVKNATPLAVLATAGQRANILAKINALRAGHEALAAESRHLESGIHQQLSGLQEVLLELEAQIAGLLPADVELSTSH